MRRNISLMLVLVLISGTFNLYGSGGRERSASEAPSAEEATVLRVGLMPAVDTAPIFAARDAGYFEEAGIDVRLQMFTNAQDRQSALQTGRIDGAMTDLVAVAVNVAGGFDIKATTLTDGMFPILAQRGAAERKQVTIGLMEVSVSNFLVDNWMSEEYELEKIYINSIPARLEALMSGQLDMGLFPEPVSSVGEMQGMEEIIYEPVGGFTPDVMVFTGAARRQKGDALRGFHRAYSKAAADLRTDPELALDTVMANVPNINPDTRDLIDLPEYHESRLPGTDYLQRIIDWTEGMLGYKLDIVPQDLVDPDFLPAERAR